MKRNILSLILAAAMAMTPGPAVCFAEETVSESGSVSESADGSDAPAKGEAKTEADGSDAPAKGEAMAAAVGSPVNMEPAKENTFPYMGVKLQYPEKLRSAVLDNQVFMRSFEDTEYTDLEDSGRISVDWRPTAENTVLHGGYIEFLYVPKELQERTPRMGMKNPMLYDEYEIWIQKTLPMARLGMYLKTEFQEEQLEETGYVRHEKLGEGGAYVYYLSTNPASKEQTAEAEALFDAAQELKKGISVFDPRPVDDSYFGITTPEVVECAQVGEFSAKTLDGETVDRSIFSGRKLTVINAWTTWCGACIEEMPELEALSQELKDEEVQVIGIACDTYDSGDGANGELLELAQRIQERTGVTFPVLIPDEKLKNGLLQSVLGYPTTWFADEEGNLIGDPVLGSNSKEDWLRLVEERLAEAVG